MDEDNEALSAQGRALPGHRFPAAEAVRGVLQARGLWDARICAELDAVRRAPRGEVHVRRKRAGMRWRWRLC